MPITIRIPKGELYDEANNRFIEVKEDVELVMEHSLLAISKWESHFHKPYFLKTNKTNEEIEYYLYCMTITKNTKMEYYKLIPKEEIERINNYINDPMTGTSIKTYSKNQGKEETQSAELIYYYMFKFNIPKECEKWHFNRLSTLLNVFGVKDAPKDKMSRSELIARNKAINAKNRARFHTKG